MPTDPARTDRTAPLFAELATTGNGTRRAELRETLLREYLDVAHNIARRYARRGEPLADLEQVATIGLLQALDRFDPERGTDFLSFAVPTITGEVRRHFRDHGWATRVPRRLKELHLALAAAMGELSQRLGRAPTARELAAHLSLSLDEVAEGLAAAQGYRSRSLDGMTDDEHSAAPESLGALGQLDPDLEQLEDREALSQLLAELPPRERTIIVLRFFGNQSQTQIATALGISQMHVSRLLSRTLATLRDKLDAAG
ncbi:MAG TPA: SigB/SigF/SigG family RNA polymerase sigma factor [Pseudonocardiaceae bacterium]